MPDSLRRALGDVFSRPEYKWVDRRHPLAWLATQWERLMNWLDTFSNRSPAGFRLLLLALIVVLALILAHIGWVMWRILRPSARSGAAPKGGAAAVVDAPSHLARAEELARAGRYAEALGHRFLAVVLELEGVEALRFHASKTPAEYVGEARLDAAGRATLAELVARLYRHLFGAVPCDETDYRAFGATAEELLRHVVPA